MASLTPSVVSASLSTKLAALAATIDRKQSGRLLQEILVDLSVLPPSQIVQTSFEMAPAIRYGWQPKNGWLDQLLGKSTSQRELVRQNPDYAWLFMFHPDGHLREIALNAINDPPASPFFFAALAWRLNDWVQPVRQAAERCAMRTLHRAAADVAADAAWYLLDRRLVWGRWKEGPKVLDAVFAREDVVSALAARIRGRSSGRTTSCLRAILRYPNIDAHLPHLAVGAVQPSIRAIAYRCLIFGKASWQVGFEWVWIDKVYGLRRSVPVLETRQIGSIRPTAELIREAAYDKSPFVRRVAAEALIADRAQSPDAAALIARLAKDRNSAIRSRADYLLRHPPSGP